VIAPPHLNSIRLRTQSDALIFRTTALMVQIRTLSDDLVLTRTNANRLRAESMRMEALCRRLESDYEARRRFIESIRFTDCDVFDDPKLLIQVNSAALECDRCGRAERLVAVVRFNSLAQVLALCGHCFQQLSELSLGAVV
jgi:hypothetical protein